MDGKLSGGCFRGQCVHTFCPWFGYRSGMELGYGRVRSFSPRVSHEPFKNSFRLDMRHIDVKALTFDITGFSRLHSTSLLERKGKMRIWEHVENSYLIPQD
jgi:hypothetical protein